MRGDLNRPSSRRRGMGTSKSDRRQHPGIDTRRNPARHLEQPFIVVASCHELDGERQAQRTAADG
jgi:hypothetical protein